MERGTKPGHRPFLFPMGHVFQTRHGPMTVVGMSRSQRGGHIWRKYYNLRCEKGHEYEVNEEYLKSGRLRTCKRCNHPTILEADPAFAAWFVDPAIPMTRPCSCHDKADFYCQRCGKIVQGKSINNIYKRREVPCPYCTNGVSYPERFMIALLEQLQVPFIHQYTVRFTRDGKPTHYKYDFLDAQRQLVIETHGMQHMIPGTFERIGGYPLEQIQQQDADKERYAIQVLQLGYIALDCRHSDPSWIRKEAEGKLPFYPLETVDWDAVHQAASKSVILQIVDLTKQGYTQAQIGQIVHMSPSTVSTKLRKAKADGLFDGVTPRMLRTQENKRRKQEQQARAKEEALRRAAMKAACEKRREERELLTQIREDALIDRIKSLPPHISVLDPYQSSRTSLRFFCQVCGQTFHRTPAAMLKDSQCPFCKKREALQQRLDSKYGNTYTVLSPYINCRTPLQFRHNICATVFSKLPGDIMKAGCPVCSRRLRSEKSAATRRSKGEQAFFALLPEIELRGYTYTGEAFQGLGKPNAFLCSHCGEVWYTTAYAIMQGTNHICTSHAKKKTHAAFVQQVRQLTGEEYSVLGTYQTALTPIKLRHNPCGLIYLAAPAHFTSSGRRCPLCTGASARGNPEQIQRRYEGWEQDLASGAGNCSYPAYIWNQKFAAAESYFHQNGHVDIPYGYIVDGYNLGSWIAEQRKLYRQNRLPEDRIRRLEKLRIKWNCIDENWQAAFEDTARFLRQHGPEPLSKERSQEERHYYYWIHDQIKRLRKGRVSPEKAALLESIGINAGYYRDAHFDIMCEKLRQFAALHGHCIVPMEEERGQPDALGLWTHRMRQRMSKGDLPPDQVRRLREIGLPENNKTAKYQQKLAALTRYYQVHGHLRIPQSYLQDGQRLGKWINGFRVRYGKGLLSPAQIGELEAIGMVWRIENTK